MRTTWPLEIADRLFSQEPARRNAQHAAVQLAHRRAEREDTERFLRAHGASPRSAGPGAGTGLGTDLVPGQPGRRTIG